MGLRFYLVFDITFDSAINSSPLVDRKLLDQKLQDTEFIPDSPVVTHLIIGILKSGELFLAVVKNRYMKTDHSQKSLKIGVGC